MKTRIQNLFLLPALTAGLGLTLAGPAAAQTFSNLHIFTALSAPAYNGGTNKDGANPLAVLILSGNKLYGTAANGGSSSNGTVFAVNIDGTGFTNLHSFTGGSDGAYPQAGLILSGTNLYGMANGGGSSGNGTVFRVNTNGTVFATLHSFTGVNDGANPLGGLILSGTNLYGTANGGGSSGNGTVFRVNTNGTVFATLHSFTALDLTSNTNTDGANPQGGLILSGTNLFGTASAGGAGGNGTVFAVSTNGAGFTNLHSFTALDPTYYTNSDGANPVAGLILSGNTLYGTANDGGALNYGTVFAVNTNGTGFTTLHSFTAMSGPLSTNSDGAYPAAGLILSGNTLYGTAQYGGNSGNGTVFAINTNGTVFTTLHSFTATSGLLSTNSDGANPASGLVLSSNILYGTAFQGGSSGNGTVFKMAPPAPILSAQRSGGNFLFGFSAFPGASYTVQQTTNLAGTNWIAFTNIFGSGTVTQFAVPATNAAWLFFRVRQP